MTLKIIVEMKNTPIGLKIISFLAKYFDDRCCPFRIKIISMRMHITIVWDFDQNCRLKSKSIFCNLNFKITVRKENTYHIVLFGF